MELIEEASSWKSLWVFQATICTALLGREAIVRCCAGLQNWAGISGCRRLVVDFGRIVTIERINHKRKAKRNKIMKKKQWVFYWKPKNGWPWIDAYNPIDDSEQASDSVCHFAGWPHWCWHDVRFSVEVRERKNLEKMEHRKPYVRTPKYRTHGHCREPCGCSVKFFHHPRF